MSLDAWLRPKSPRASMPPTKKFKNSAGSSLDDEKSYPLTNSSPNVESSSLDNPLDRSSFSERENELNSGKIVPEFFRKKNRPKCHHTLPKFRIANKHAVTLYDALPENFLRTTIAKQWACGEQSNLHSSPVWIEPLLESPLAAVATKKMNTVFTWSPSRLEYSQDPKIEALVDVPFEWDIKHITAVNTNQLLCTSRTELCLLDIIEQKTSSVPFFKREDVAEISSVKSHSDGRLIALGTAAGDINVWDLRERTWARCWTRAHDIAGSAINRVTPAISTLLWSSDNVLATASNLNESVKFWDIRARTNSPLMTTNERTSSPTHHSTRAISIGDPNCLKGIRSMVTLDGAVWAINEARELLKLSPYQPMPECKIKITSRIALDATQPLAVISDGSHQILGCAGESGLVTIVPPSREANERGVDATCGFSFQSPTLAYEMSSLSFNPVGNCVLSASRGDKCIFSWQIGTSHAGPVKVRQQPLYF